MIDPRNDQLPVGLIAQLDDHHPGIAVGRFQIPFRPEKLSISKCMADHSKIDLKNLGPSFATALVP